MHRLGEDTRQGRERRPQQSEKKDRLRQGYDGRRDEVGQRGNKADAAKHPCHEWCRDCARDEGCDQLSRDLSFPPIQALREVTLPQGSSGNQSAHAEHAQLIADVDRCTWLNQRHKRTDRPRRPR